MNQTAPVLSAADLNAEKARPSKERAHFVRQANGDLRGSNFTIPKGDFAHFLGYRPETRDERERGTTGQRAIEIALREKFNQLGKGAVERGDAYRNMAISWGRFGGQPGRERDMMTDGLDAIHHSMEQQSELSMRYLEMQYKFQEMSKNFSCISNLMKVRNESVRKCMSDAR